MEHRNAQGWKLPLLLASVGVAGLHVRHEQLDEAPLHHGGAKLLVGTDEGHHHQVGPGVQVAAEQTPDAKEGVEAVDGDGDAGKEHASEVGVAVGEAGDELAHHDSDEGPDKRPPHSVDDDQPKVLCVPAHRNCQEEDRENHRHAVPRKAGHHQPPASAAQLPAPHGQRGRREARDEELGRPGRPWTQAVHQEARGVGGGQVEGEDEDEGPRRRAQDEHPDLPGRAPLA
mmetsp:Transcript_4747/g.14886  ORF Transcript_4747/g.14886 Transcript_4747/m.14886 type:complete len:229 (-) Transcript_4747:402-1088(-)